jgi:hypothetical protein
MPKKPIDYSKALIYSIVCKTDENLLYIGSTTNFRMRKSSHKCVCNNEKNINYNVQLYVMIRANGGWDNFEMKPIKEYSCENNIQLVIEEERIRKEINSNLNTLKAYRTIEEKQEDHKNYVINNREKVNETRQKWIEENREKVNERKRKWAKANREQHKEEMNEKHRKWSKKYREEHKEKEKERQRKWREKNKEKVNETRRKWIEENREKINRQKRERKAKNIILD